MSYEYYYDYVRCDILYMSLVYFCDLYYMYLHGVSCEYCCDRVYMCLFILYIHVLYTLSMSFNFDLTLCDMYMTTCMLYILFDYLTLLMKQKLEECVCCSQFY